MDTGDGLSLWLWWNCFSFCTERTMPCAPQNGKGQLGKQRDPSSPWQDSYSLGPISTPITESGYFCEGAEEGWNTGPSSLTHSLTPPPSPPLFISTLCICRKHQGLSALLRGLEYGGKIHRLDTYCWGLGRCCLGGLSWVLSQARLLSETLSQT